jgi:hypothetical protein
MRFGLFGIKKFQKAETERKREMTDTKTIEDFPVGTKVVFDLDGIKVHGTVESIQLGKKLVDVKIYEAGHRDHCRIVARPPETLYDAADDDGPSSYADLQKRVEGETHESVRDLQGALSRLLERVEALEESVRSLQAKVALLESKPDGGIAASA